MTSHLCCSRPRRRGDDRCALRLGERDVLVDQIYVRVDYSERAVALAPEQERGTSVSSFSSSRKYTRASKESTSSA